MDLNVEIETSTCWLDSSRSGTPAGTSSAPAVTVEINDAPAIVEHPAEEGQCMSVWTVYSGNCLKRKFM